MASVAPHMKKIIRTDYLTLTVDRLDEEALRTQAVRWFRCHVLDDEFAPGERGCIALIVTGYTDRLRGRSLRRFTERGLRPVHRHRRRRCIVRLVRRAF